VVSCSCCPATARWASACRSAASPAPPPPSGPSPRTCRIRSDAPDDDQPRRAEPPSDGPRDHRAAAAGPPPGRGPAEPSTRPGGPEAKVAAKVEATAEPEARRATEPLPGIRTALAIEPRDGELWVFVPPVARFDEFCALIAAIDHARAATGVAVHLEGYPPPPSPDRLRFAVTPDPGVLEVNLPPVASCHAASALHHAVFEAALASGLTAERYLLDGRAAGSGGGNHITIGGPSPERSPGLR
jgi:uncharacterized protein (DUF2126 family)